MSHTRSIWSQKVTRTSYYYIDIDNTLKYYYSVTCPLIVSVGAYAPIGRYYRIVYLAINKVKM